MRKRPVLLQQPPQAADHRGAEGDEIAGGVRTVRRAAECLNPLGEHRIRGQRRVGFAGAPAGEPPMDAAQLRPACVQRNDGQIEAVDGAAASGAQLPAN